MDYVVLTAARLARKSAILCTEQLFRRAKVVRNGRRRPGPADGGVDFAVQRAQPPHSHPWLAEAIFALDARLRRHQAVLEYTQHPSCIFRLQIDRSRRPLALCDGTHLRPGQGIARLHFWNEHVPPIPKSGAMIGWAHQFQQGIAISLRELVHYLSSRPDLRDVAVICANAPSSKLARIMARYGFEAIAEDERLPIGGRIHRFGEDILISR